MDKWAHCAPLLVSWFMDAVVATIYPFPPRGHPVRFRSVVFYVFLVAATMYLSYVSATVAATKVIGADTGVVDLIRRVRVSENRVQALEDRVESGEELLGDVVAVAFRRHLDAYNPETGEFGGYGGISVSENAVVPLSREEFEEMRTGLGGLEMNMEGVLAWLKILSGTICDSGLSELGESEFCVEFH